MPQNLSRKSAKEANHSKIKIIPNQSRNSKMIFSQSKERIKKIINHKSSPIIQKITSTMRESKPHDLSQHADEIGKT